jgi:hypothetical protein
VTEIEAIANPKRATAEAASATPMSTERVTAVAAVRDDRTTVIAIALLACILQDVLHEGFGHGVAAWLSGARQLTISTVALTSDIETRLISAAGTLVNLLFGGVFWLLLRKPERYSPTTRFFFVMAMAGNLFTGTGYFGYSGIFNIGDWAAVIRGLEPHWLWRVGLVALGYVSYWLAMLLVARELRAFHDGNLWRGRIRRITWLPYFADAVLAAIAGLLNPAGLVYVITSALPSTLGANSGLLWMPTMMGKMKSSEETTPGPIGRSMGWIVAGAICVLLYVVVLARGITWTR